MINSYRFKIGDFQCIAVSDGSHTYTPPTFPPPPVFLFSNAPKDQLDSVLREYKLDPGTWSEWVSPYICLLINTGKQLVLVDTGAGDLSPETGKLPENLKKEEIGVGDIDVIIHTHGHPDHIGGNIDSEGKLVFPNARYIICKTEWDFWNSEESVKQIDEHSRDVLVGYANKNLPPIKDKVDLIEYGVEIVPGIRTVAAPGHTPGHMALSIKSGDDQLLCVSDTVLHPIHLEFPGWSAAVDLDPAQVESSRKEILDKASTEDAMVMAFHFPFPGLGYITREKDAWKWRQLENEN
ncbi:MAG: MBL fold metallo-hydrolase [Dehalococcoidales bacterium]|nr:MAG: MBL fold metallo-hydrolase [Dehalococcoidales bacterium]